MSARLVSFEKWEGLGNDFILVRVPEQQAQTWPAETVQRLCDRRRGIGADGVLFIAGADSLRPRMIVCNADGSRPEMCGNGIRCVAGHLLQGKPSGDLIVATDAGDKRCATRALGPDAFEVSVHMGAATLAEPLTVSLDGEAHSFSSVDVGNPHAITFEPYDPSRIDHVAPRIAATPPGGINVEFCRMLASAPPRIEVTVWERGVGRTLACGTGACAVAAVACETGRASFGVPILIALPGGDLEITVANVTRELTMKGPARKVFHGQAVIA
jgi:diaminopimelate epimerase